LRIPKKGEIAEIHNEYEEYIIAVYAYVHTYILFRSTYAQAHIQKTLQ